MSDQIFAIHTANDIRASLKVSSGSIKRVKAIAIKRKYALRQIIANLTMGNYNQMMELFPEIIKFLSIEDDLEVKRICHEFLVMVGPAKPGAVLEALPLLLQDLERSYDDEVVLMTLRTLTSLPIPQCHDEACKYIEYVLKRELKSVRIRKAAVNSIPKLASFDPTRTKLLVGLLEEQLLRAEDVPTVLVAVLGSLHKIYQQNNYTKKLSITKNICYILLHHLANLNEWDKAALLDYLCLIYVPISHYEARSIIGMVLPQLKHKNSSVVLNCSKYIIYLSNYTDYVNDFVIKKLSNALISLLNKSPELKFLALRNIILLLLSRQYNFLSMDISHFFIESTDPMYVKDTKLEVLYLLADDSNLLHVLDELGQYAIDMDIHISRKSIRAIGNLAVKSNAVVDHCVDVLLELLRFDVEYVTQEAVTVMKNIMRTYPGRFGHVFPILSQYVGQVKGTECTSAMIWITAEYAAENPNAITILNDFAYNFTTLGIEVQYALLNSIVKFFIRTGSKESEQLCLGILKTAIDKSRNPDLRDRALFYWRLLSLHHQPINNLLTDQEIETIVDGELPPIIISNKLDPALKDELELSIGTVASIYLKPLAEVFHSKTQELKIPKSPAYSGSSSLMILKNGSTTSFDSMENASDTSHSSYSIAMKTMADHDLPAEKTNVLLKHKSSGNLSARKVSGLVRKLSIRNPF